MAQRTGSLYVDLTLNFAKFVQGLDQSRTKATAFGVAFGNVMSSIATSIAKMTKDAALSLPRLVESSIDIADQMGKMAQKAQVTTESFTALAHAADLSGISTDTLATNLGRFGRNVAEAESGNKKIAAAFRDVGVSLNDLKTLSIDELFAKVAGGFSAIPEGAKKAQVGFELFGRGFQDLIPLLNKGTDGITAAIEEAKKLGLVIGGDTAKQAEQFNDNIKALHGTLSGFGFAIAKDVLPQLLALSSQFVQVAKDAALPGEIAKGLGTAFRDSLIVLDRLAIEWLAFVISLQEGILQVEKTAYAFHLLGDAGAKDMAGLSGRLEDNKKLLFELYDAGVKLTKIPPADNLSGFIGPKQVGPAIVDETAQKKLDDLIASFQKALKPADDLNNELLQLSKAGKSSGDILAAYGDQIEKVISAQLGTGKSIPPFIESLDEQRIAAILAKLANEGWTLSLNEMQDSSRDAAIRVSVIKESLKDLQDEIDRMDLRKLGSISTPIDPTKFIGIDLEEIAKGNKDAIDSINQAGEEAAKRTAALAKTAEEANKRFDELSKTIGTAFEDAIVGGKGLRGILGGLVQDLERMILRFTIILPLQKQFTQMLENARAGNSGGILGTIFGAISSVIGGAAGAASGGAAAFNNGAISQLPSGANLIPPSLPRIPLLATGGIVTRPTLAMFGEKGPEAVIPLGRLGNSQPGLQVNYNIDARGADPGAEERIRQALRETHDRAVANSVRLMQEMKLRTA